MEFIKKICLLFITAILGVVGYVLVSKHCKMSESGSVVIQGNPFKASTWKKVGGDFNAPKQGANNTACSKNSQCNSNHCIAGMCQPATTAMCNKHSDCQKDEYCQSGKCHNKVQKGEWCETKGFGDNEVINASCITGNCARNVNGDAWKCS